MQDFITIHSLAEHAVLRTAVFKLRSDSRKQYRTRRLELAPPAASAFIASDGLPLARGAVGTPPAKALLVRLPLDFEPSLAHLAVAAPDLVVHPDTGLQAQGAYLSMSSPTDGPEPPRTVWLDVAPVLEVLAESKNADGNSAVPLVLAAGQSFTVRNLKSDAQFEKRCEQALLDAANLPTLRHVDMAKAKLTAERYGERPWLFMRYDVRTGGRKLAVNWAAMPERLPACVL